MASARVHNGHTQEATTLSLSGTVIDESPATSPANSHFSPISPTETLEETAGLTDNQPASVPAVIPPEHTNRTLILCFDGTGDQFDADNSNIVQLVSLLKKDDRTKQLVYYQAGIGTYTSPQIATPFVSKMRKKLDEMFAWNLHAHVMSGYEFLMQNYITGDNICLFGFSRGAYTARSLAGMLHKVGLLPAGNFQQVPFAYKMYKRADHVGWEQSNEFKKAFSVDVQIEFIGVWDTVDAVGLIPKRLPFTTSNTIVNTFRHAVSLDERRAKFKANLWNRPTAEEAKLGVEPPKLANTRCALVEGSRYSHPHRAHSLDDPSQHKLPGKFGANLMPNGKHRAPMPAKESKGDKKLNTLERLYSEKQERVTDIEEVWFAGCHCDVGGGSVSNKTRHALARITLRWMVRECFKANTGIMFNSAALLDIGLDPATLYPYVKPRPPPLPLVEEGKDDIKPHRLVKPPPKAIPLQHHAYLRKRGEVHPDFATLLEEKKVPFLGSEEEEEIRDAMSPYYDQLDIKKSWWILEILPLQLRYQRGNNEWVSYFGSNLARPRFIPKQRTNGFKVHRSVKLRIDAEYEDEVARRKGKKYIPRPHFHVEPTWID